MVFNIEIVPKGEEYAITETVVHEGHDPAAWTDADVESVLKEILSAIDRVANPGEEERAVTLRGFSWIVEPSDDQVVIAIEIPSGAAVAGPFDIEQQRLDEMVARVIAAAKSSYPGTSASVH
jgi:hypothetical protein